MAKSMEAKFRAKIARKAIKEVGQRACTRETDGKAGYFTSCNGNGGQPEYWCSDFARWIWWKARAVNTDPKMGSRLLTAESGSFAKYGKLRRKPRVGDAVLFNYNKNIKSPNADHVAIVVKVNKNGTIRSVSGDLNGRRGSQADFASTSLVVHDRPYNGAIDSSDLQAPNSPVSGYISPVEDDMPYTKKQIRQLVKDGVAAEMKTEIGNSGITPAQGAKAAVHAHQELQLLRQQVEALAKSVAQFVADHPAVTPAPLNGPPAPPANGPGSTSGTRRRTATRTATSPTT